MTRSYLTPRRNERKADKKFLAISAALREIALRFRVALITLLFNDLPPDAWYR
jgi:hypothetical protein